MNFKELREYTQNLSVLYVEDDSDLREQTTHIFSRIFFKVDTAKDGVEAFELFKNNSYDIVLSDLQMPKRNGLELSKLILKEKPSQKIVIISAHDEGDVTAHLELLNIKYLINKPILQEPMIDTLYAVSIA